MAEEASAPAAPLPEVAVPEPTPAQPAPETVPELKDNTVANGSGIAKGTPEEGKTVATAPPAPVETGVPTPDTTNGGQTTSEKPHEAKPAETPQDVEMKDTTRENITVVPPVSAPAAGEPTNGAVEAPASGSKARGTPRRKSSGIPEHKGKKLSKKASRAKITHSDAQPGDHFFVRLKGYPLWPAIVCDETMLPEPILKSRPVTAARADGTYRADYADGGPKVKDRTFPVMYLQTNEFGWIPNTDLVDLDPETVLTPATLNMRKDLAAAHQLAANENSLDYYKAILQSFVEQKAAEAEAKAAETAAKEAARAAKKAKKATPKKSKAVDADGDVDMDAIGEPDDEELNVAGSDEKPTKSKKRKPEDDAETPQRSDSVKKPKTTIKLNTPRTNGTMTPKSAKESAKSSKPKTKKAAKPAEAPEEVAPKEPELSPEEKRVKKEKEILFLRHKLQKGLLTRDQEPKEEEMKQMSEFVTKLEGYADLEVSIIRATKINKVLKAILKLTTIPREEEFNFKPRSTALLDKWNKLLASEQGTPAAGAFTNGNGSEAKPSTEAKASPAEASSGTKETTEEPKFEPKAEAKIEETTTPVEAYTAASATKANKEPDAVPDTPPVEETTKEENPEPALVESTAQVA